MKTRNVIRGNRRGERPMICMRPGLFGGRQRFRLKRKYGDLKDGGGIQEPGGDFGQSDRFCRRINQIRGVSWEWSPGNPSASRSSSGGEQGGSKCFSGMWKRGPPLSTGTVQVLPSGCEAAILWRKRWLISRIALSALSDGQTKQGVKPRRDALRRLRVESSTRRTSKLSLARRRGL